LEVLVPEELERKDLKDRQMVLKGFQVIEDFKDPKGFKGYKVFKVYNAYSEYRVT
jgi:hypothetical protein